MKGLYILIALVVLALTMSAQTLPVYGFLPSGGTYIAGQPATLLLASAKAEEVEVDVQVYTVTCASTGKMWIFPNLVNSGTCEEDDRWATESVVTQTTSPRMKLAAVSFTPEVDGAYYRLRLVRRFSQPTAEGTSYEWVEDLPLQTAGLNPGLVMAGPPPSWQTLAYVRAGAVDVTIADSGNITTTFQGWLGIDTAATGYMLQVGGGRYATVVPVDLVVTSTANQSGQLSDVLATGVATSTLALSPDSGLTVCIRPSSSTLTACGAIYDPSFPTQGSTWTLGAQIQ